MSQVEDTITKLESLRRISMALTRDLEGLLESLKAQPEQPAADLGNRSVELPYARDAFAAPKPATNVEVMQEQQRRQLNPQRRALPEGYGEALQINQPGRGPQPITEAVEELLQAVEEQIPARGPQSPGEVLTKYLSPSILAGGRGFVQPGANGLKRYKEDLTNPELETSELVHFPTGFYAADAQGQDQFFIVASNFLVLVYGLRSTPAIGVRLRANMGEMLSTEELSAGERLQVSKELEVVMQLLSPQ